MWSLLCDPNGLLSIPLNLRFTCARAAYCVMGYVHTYTYYYIGMSEWKKFRSSSSSDDTIGFTTNFVIRQKAWIRWNRRSIWFGRDTLVHVLLLILLDAHSVSPIAIDLSVGRIFSNDMNNNSTCRNCFCWFHSEATHNAHRYSCKMIIEKLNLLLFTLTTVSTLLFFMNCRNHGLKNHTIRPFVKRRRKRRDIFHQNAIFRSVVGILLTAYSETCHCTARQSLVASFSSNPSTMHRLHCLYHQFSPLPKNSYWPNFENDLPWS